MIIDEKKKLFNTSPLSDRVSNWSKKINEASPLTPGRNDYGLPTGLKSTNKKTKTTKVNPNNLPVAEKKDYTGKIDSNVLKAYPELDPTKPGDYIRLKRLSSKIKRITERKKLNPNAVFPTVSNVKIKNEIISDSGISNKNSVKKKFPTESKMTPTQKERKEKYVKGMKKAKSGFTKRYGKDGKSVMYATATKMAMKKEETLVEKPGDGYLGPTIGKVGIPNPIRMAKDAVDQMNRANLKKVKTLNQISPGSATMPKFKEFNPTTSAAFKNLFQSHEPEGEMTEAKYEKGASTYGKASIRNKRMFGKGGNARPPEERGAAIKVRQARHQERRYVKKGNKYHEPGKYRPEVHGVNKPEQERKGKNIKEGSLHSWFKGSKSKDGKPGWVNVVTGGTCASDKKGEGTPKCVSSSKRASMTKAERLSASRRKKKADPGQQSKSGAAKPTYVATDSKKKK